MERFHLEQNLSILLLYTRHGSMWFREQLQRRRNMISIANNQFSSKYSRFFCGAKIARCQRLSCKRRVYSYQFWIGSIRKCSTWLLCKLDLGLPCFSGPVILNLGSIEPQGLSESVLGFVGVVHPTLMMYVILCFSLKFMFCWFCFLNIIILCANDALYNLCTNIIYTCIYSIYVLNLKKRKFNFSNYSVMHI